MQGFDNSNNLIHLQWLEPDNGGSNIIGYIVYYKKIEDLNYQNLVGEDSTYD